METNQEPQEQQAVALQRSFVIPGCSVVIHSGQHQTIEDLLGIVFSIATSNPEASVEFSIKIEGN